MSDRGILFSTPMVQALWRGDKTQTRRLDTSPLRKLSAGDRLYVREHWKTSALHDDIAPCDLDPASSILMLADNVVPTKAYRAPFGRHRQAMHMPRWASRLTLIVEDVKVERLQDISEGDALAEGVVPDDGLGFHVPGVEHPNKDFPCLSRPSAREMYAALWDVIHGSGKWLTNPFVVALTFRVIRANIDTLSPPAIPRAAGGSAPSIDAMPGTDAASLEPPATVEAVGVPDKRDPIDDLMREW